MPDDCDKPTGACSVALLVFPGSGLGLSLTFFRSRKLLSRVAMLLLPMSDEAVAGTE